MSSCIWRVFSEQKCARWKKDVWKEAPERGNVTTARAVWILSAFSLLNGFLSLRKKPEETPSYLGKRRELHDEVERALSLKLNSVSVTNCVILVIFHKVSMSQRVYL